MINNIFIFHKGAALYHRNVAGSALDLQIVEGFNSSFLTFRSYLQKTQRKINARGGAVAGDSSQNSVRCSYFRSGVDMFIYMQCGDFTLVSHSPDGAGKEVVSRSTVVAYRDR